MYKSIRANAAIPGKVTLRCVSVNDDDELVVSPNTPELDISNPGACNDKFVRNANKLTQDGKCIKVTPQERCDGKKYLTLGQYTDPGECAEFTFNNDTEVATVGDLDPTTFFDGGTIGDSYITNDKSRFCEQLGIYDIQTDSAVEDINSIHSLKFKTI